MRFEPSCRFLSPIGHPWPTRTRTLDFAKSKVLHFFQNGRTSCAPLTILRESGAMCGLASFDNVITAYVDTNFGFCEIQSPSFFQNGRTSCAPLPILRVSGAMCGLASFDNVITAYVDADFEFCEIQGPSFFKMVAPPVLHCRYYGYRARCAGWLPSITSSPLTRTRTLGFAKSKVLHCSKMLALPVLREGHGRSDCERGSKLTR